LLKDATKEVQPSLRREGFSSIPEVTWADVGGLDSLREELYRCIVRCIKHPEYYEVNLVMSCVFILVFFFIEKAVCLGSPGFS
jgi:SpoVK/Ycf46/Vps4 family AAA+-type ATPase